ncbi:MAG: hypothetical protein BGO49_03190 [Planctomycetales bacterium 71-10]|nr:MAG: hypothetical protein BGO49_03190 [Planctomycetales bacterium 71-10]
MVDETLTSSGSLRVGCAGWSLPSGHAERFPAEGTHLSRYAARFPAVEINSSFYRPHRPATYARWAASVPEGFRFAVKVPRAVTHERRLIGATDLLATFLDEASHLGDKLGPLLVQLPPSLSFSAEVAEAFFEDLRSRFDGEAVFEPRHATWFAPAAERLIARHRVARVAADPAVVPEAAQPGGWEGLAYYRLHGSPKVYYSSYPDEYLSKLANKLATATGKAAVWCIFDNTAEGAAITNGLDVLERIGRAPG